jgi:hypothetical protein
VQRAGSVVLFDVIENIVEPLAFLGRLKTFLAPRGCMLILTGAHDSLAWRLFGRRYWYASLPEHVSFFSLRWFRWAAAQLDMRVVAHRRICSERRSARSWAMQLVRLSLFSAVQHLRDLGTPERLLTVVPLMRKAAAWRSVPW